MKINKENKVMAWATLSLQLEEIKEFTNSGGKMTRNGSSKVE